MHLKSEGFYSKWIAEMIIKWLARKIKWKEHSENELRIFTVYSHPAGGKEWIRNTLKDQEETI